MRTGNCKWLGNPLKEDLRDGTALLRIVTSKGVETHYWVFHNGRETRLKKFGTGEREVYACNLQTGWCECPDHQNRAVTCKHVKALRAALARLS